MSNLDDRLFPVFVRQHWLVSLADVEAAGGSRRQIAERLRMGRWERAEVGVYRLIGAPDGWERRLLAPILSFGAGAVASHFAAAALHGIDGFGKGTPELSIPRGGKLRRPSARVHTSTDLERCDPVERNGIPTTDLPRTLLDIGRRLSDKRLHQAIEDARRNGLVTWATMAGTLARHARRGRPGVRRLRRVILANADRREITDSTFELLALSLLAEEGMPEPVLHHRVMAGGRFVAEVDLAYPELKIAIELDGAVHLDPAVRERDLAKQNALLLEGWIVLRFTWDRFRRRPDLFIAEITAALAAR